jgi:hypothetical protein
MGECNEGGTKKWHDLSLREGAPVKAHSANRLVSHTGGGGGLGPVLAGRCGSSGGPAVLAKGAMRPKSCQKRLFRSAANVVYHVRAFLVGIWRARPIHYRNAHNNADMRLPRGDVKLLV